MRSQRPYLPPIYRRRITEGVSALLILALGALVVVTAGMTRADAAPAPRLQIQHISQGEVGEPGTSTEPQTVEVTIRFKCVGAPVGTFLQVETVVVQGEDEAVGMGPSALCTGRSQETVAVAYTDPFFGDTLEPGKARVSATIYGCPAGTDEFCDNFITTETRTIRLR